MGLFGTLLQAGGGIIGSLVGGSANKKAIKKASKAEIAAMQAAIDEQRRQFDLTRSDYMPWMDAGKQALGGYGDIVGLNGGEDQQAALDGLRESPLFQSIFDSGKEAILQSASATGGVRGGNVQRSLADFGSDAFSSVIQQQLANLGGLSGAGAGMTQSIGSLGSQMAGQVGNLLVGQGQARSGSILGRRQVDNNTASQIQQILMSAATGGMGGGFGGIGGGMGGGMGF